MVRQLSLNYDEDNDEQSSNWEDELSDSSM